MQKETHPGDRGTGASHFKLVTFTSLQVCIIHPALTTWSIAIQINAIQNRDTDDSVARERAEYTRQECQTP